jgi:hypothetical protein
MKIKEGDTVCIKKGVMDPDFKGFLIQGYRGTVFEVDDDTDKTLIGIKWDAETLSNMPRKMLNRCRKENWDYEKMYLYEDDLEIVSVGS